MSSLSITNNANQIDNANQRDVFSIGKEPLGIVYDYLSNPEKCRVSITCHQGRTYLQLHVKDGVEELAKIMSKAFETIPSLVRFNFEIHMPQDPTVAQLFSIKFQGKDTAFVLYKKIPAENINIKNEILNTRLCLDGDLDLVERMESFPKVGDLIMSNSNTELEYPDWCAHGCRYGGMIAPRNYAPVKELIKDCVKRGRLDLVENIINERVPYVTIDYKHGQSFSAKTSLCGFIAEACAEYGLVDECVEWFGRTDAIICPVEKLFKASISSYQLRAALDIKNRLPPETHGPYGSMNSTEREFKYAIVNLQSSSISDRLKLIKKAIEFRDSELLQYFIAVFPEIINDSMFHQAWVACGSPTDLGPQFGQNAFLGNIPTIQGEELHTLRLQVFDIVSASPNISIYIERDETMAYINQLGDCTSGYREDDLLALLEDPSKQHITQLIYQKMAKKHEHQQDEEDGFGERAFKGQIPALHTQSTLYPVSPHLVYDRRMVIGQVKEEINNNFNKYMRQLKPNTFV